MPVFLLSINEVIAGISPVVKIVNAEGELSLALFRATVAVVESKVQLMERGKRVDPLYRQRILPAVLWNVKLHNPRTITKTKIRLCFFEAVNIVVDTLFDSCEVPVNVMGHITHQ